MYFIILSTHKCCGHAACGDSAAFEAHMDCLLHVLSEEVLLQVDVLVPVGKYELEVTAQLADYGCAVVPNSTVESNAVSAQLVEDVLHLHSRDYVLDEDACLDCS